MPDTQLLDLAAQNKLHTPRGPRRSRSGACWPIRRPSALTTNFAGQWLYLRNLKNMQPNSEEFPDFDDNLRQALRARSLAVLQPASSSEDRNVLDLMTRRLHVPERAPRAALRHSERLRQPLPARDAARRDARSGLLGKGAVLMVTSHVDRTSPVVRGKWVLDNLLKRARAADAEQRAAAQRRRQPRRHAS